MSITSTEGALITTDAAMRQYILHLDEKQASGAESFVLAELDSTHLLVKHEAVEMIERKIDELQSTNTFSREPDGTSAKPAAIDEPKPKRGKKAAAAAALT